MGWLICRDFLHPGRKEMSATQTIPGFFRLVYYCLEQSLRSYPLVAIIPWWNTVPPGARIGAFFNLVIVIVVVTPIREKVLELFT
jgi:hypothetical protein